MAFGNSQVSIKSSTNSGSGKVVINSAASGFSNGGKAAEEALKKSKEIEEVSLDMESFTNKASETETTKLTPEQAQERLENDPSLKVYSNSVGGISSWYTKGGTAVHSQGGGELIRDGDGVRGYEDRSGNIVWEDESKEYDGDLW